MLTLPRDTLKPDNDASAAKFGVPVVKTARDVLIKPPPLTEIPLPLAMTTSAGRRAEVVIANGSGISVNGGGFINTSRAVLTTGTPNFAADGSLSGFNVSRGSVSIAGAGLNASEVDQVDLLARAVEVNGAIYAE